MRSAMRTFRRIHVWPWPWPCICRLLLTCLYLAWKRLIYSQIFRTRKLCLRTTDLFFNFTILSTVCARQRVNENACDLETHLSSFFRSYLTNNFEILLLSRQKYNTYAVAVSLTLTHDLDLDKVTKLKISHCDNFFTAGQIITKFKWDVHVDIYYQRMQ